MKGSLAMLKLDLLTALSGRGWLNYLFLIALGSFLTLLGFVPFDSFLVYLLASGGILQIFRTQQTAGLGKLYRILPLSKADVVNGRFLFALLHLVLAAVQHGLILILSRFLGAETPDAAAACVQISFSLLLFAVIYCFYFQELFRYGRIKNNAGVFAFILGLILLVIFPLLFFAETAEVIVSSPQNSLLFSLIPILLACLFLELTRRSVLRIPYLFDE